MDRKLKVFATTWHVMHYHDLFNALKEDADFYLVHNSNRSWKDKRFLKARPIPENVTFVPYYEPATYDFAILNVDQQLANPLIGKRRVYERLNALIIDIPKVVINHGAPVYPEYCLQDGMTKEKAQEWCRKEIMKLIGDNVMITNSYKVAEEWGKGYPIHHGMNPSEWYDLPKEVRVFTAVSPAGLDEYYNRAMMEEVRNILRDKYEINLWWAKQNAISDGDFDRYREYLGRSLIYFDGSFRTPMNRARTEAMLSGACVVQVKGAHDLDRFAKDGENMILVDNNPRVAADLIFDLLENRYKECIEIGQRGKKTAQEKFNYKRYRDDWMNIITNVLHV